MTATFEEVREALAATVRPLPGLLSSTAKVPEKYAPTCAYVGPAPGDFINFRPDLDDDVDYHLVVTLVVQGTDIAAAQTTMDAYLVKSGPMSVIAAINAGGNLGGIVSSARCNVARNYRAEIRDEGRFVLADFPVDIMT